MSPNDADGMANSVDPDQTTLIGSALFAQTYLYSMVRPFYSNFMAITANVSCVRMFRILGKQI